MKIKCSEGCLDQRRHSGTQGCEGKLALASDQHLVGAH